MLTNFENNGFQNRFFLATFTGGIKYCKKISLRRINKKCSKNKIIKNNNILQRTDPCNEY